MYLRDLAIYADKRIVERHPGGFVQQFHRETCCITELYRTLLYRKVVTKDTVKVHFTFTDAIRTPPNSAVLGPTRDMPGANVLLCPWPFDFEAYTQVNVRGRKEQVIAAMQAGLLWIAANREWARQPFENAYREAFHQNLVFEGFGKKSWVSPDNRFRARVYFRFEMDKVELFAVLYLDRSRLELGRVKLGSGPPEMGVVTDYTSDGKWVSPTSFEIRSSTFQRQVWSVEFRELMRTV